jgi:hypothetical protein
MHLPRIQLCSLRSAGSLVRSFPDAELKHIQRGEKVPFDTAYQFTFITSLGCHVSVGIRLNLKCAKLIVKHYCECR